MNKAFVAMGFIALIITCIFAAREPISLVFIVGAFVLIGYLFAKIGEKAKFNNHLSDAERKGTFRFCSVGFLALSLAANIGFLFWVNSKTPIWGDQYVERMQYEARKKAEKREAQEQDKKRIIAGSTAEKSVKSNLKDPSSAKFSEVKIGKDGSVCGTVNAKNSFGAYSGDSRYVSSGGNAVIDDGSQEFSNVWDSQCN